jgi:NAD(P)H-dependent FMN reductase
MATAMIKVAALSGSLRKASYHSGLIRSGNSFNSFSFSSFLQSLLLLYAYKLLMIVHVAIELSKGTIEGIEIEFIDISNLPMLNTDLENNGTYPPLVEAFRYKILQADSVLFASPPEYNYSLTGTI